MGDLADMTAMLTRLGIIRRLNWFGLLLSLLVIAALVSVACDGEGVEETTTQEYFETQQGTFAVADSPALTVDNFAGNVTVRAGEAGTIRVVAVKRAASEGDLRRIEVRMRKRDGGLEITTDKPSGLQTAWVALEITAPRRTRVDLNTGGGNVSVSGLDGRVEMDTAGGNIELSDASGEIHMETGGGKIDISNASGEIDARTGGGSIAYQGTPQGSFRFDTGAGDIRLRLPAELNVKVDLDTGTGEIDVDWPVDGQVSKRRVRGTIGSGDEGEIEAHAGAGNIDLISQ
jgi:DUF4097 and DUF4098 domain-containing protein YvlB